MVALLTSVRNSPCFGGLRRTKTCHRQLFARPSTCFLVTFCTTQKVTIRSLCREHRGSVNLESAHSNNTFPLTKLKPFQKGDSRFCKPRISAQNYNFAQAQLNPFATFGGLLSAVSDAQKLATSNFLHVRAAFCGGQSRL